MLGLGERTSRGMVSRVSHKKAQKTRKRFEVICAFFVVFVTENLIDRYVWRGVSRTADSGYIGFRDRYLYRHISSAC